MRVRVFHAAARLRSQVLLRRIANADDDDGMAEQTSGAEERGAKGPLRDIREEEQGKPETVGLSADLRP